VSILEQHDRTAKELSDARIASLWLCPRRSGSSRLVAGLAVVLVLRDAYSAMERLRTLPLLLPEYNLGEITTRVCLTVPLLPKQAAYAAQFGRKSICTKLHNFV
jgi:hypothetical protein